MFVYRLSLPVDLPMSPQALSNLIITWLHTKHIEFEPYNKKDGVTYYWDAPDVDGADYENWERAWSFLKYVHPRTQHGNTIQDQ